LFKKESFRHTKNGDIGHGVPSSLGSSHQIRFSASYIIGTNAINTV